MCAILVGVVSGHIVISSPLLAAAVLAAAVLAVLACTASLELTMPAYLPAFVDGNEYRYTSMLKVHMCIP